MYKTVIVQNATVCSFFSEGDVTQIENTDGLQKMIN